MIRRSATYKCKPMWAPKRSDPAHSDLFRTSSSKHRTIGRPWHSLSGTSSNLTREHTWSFVICYCSNFGFPRLRMFHDSGPSLLSFGLDTGVEGHLPDKRKIPINPVFSPKNPISKGIIKKVRARGVENSLSIAEIR